MSSHILFSYLSHCVKDCFIFYSLLPLSLSLCRCDPHSWSNCSRTSRRAGEDSTEIMLQEQPENSHWKRCSFCGEMKSWWFLLYDKKQRQRKTKIEDAVSCFLLQREWSRTETWEIRLKEKDTKQGESNTDNDRKDERREGKLRGELQVVFTCRESVWNTPRGRFHNKTRC